MGYQDRGNGSNGGEMMPRAPLQWKTEKSFESGRIRLVLQSAELERGGKRWSFRIGKASQEQPDKPFPFMDPRDTNEVRTVMIEMEAYLAEVRSSGVAD